jgi:hypothetical protein
MAVLPERTDGIFESSEKVRAIIIIRGRLICQGSFSQKCKKEDHHGH